MTVNIVPGSGLAQKRLLILMGKRPEPGGTKTRLVPPLSATDAADLFACFLADKVAQMRQVRAAELAVAYSPRSARAYFADLAPGFRLIQQTGSSLGRRLANAFNVAFDQGYAYVMAIDGDSPTLPVTYLERGLECLTEPTVDVVLGPAVDGGYYGIGLKEPEPSLFEVRMSTPRVLADTLARAEAAALRVRLLPEWYDVDTLADLSRLAAELRSGRDTVAPQTARFARDRLQDVV